MKAVGVSVFMSSLSCGAVLRPSVVWRCLAAPALRVSAWRRALRICSPIPPPIAPIRPYSPPPVQSRPSPSIPVQDRPAMSKSGARAGMDRAAPPGDCVQGMARGGGEVGSCARSSVRSQFGSNQTAQAIIAQAQSGLEWHCCLKTGNVAARRSTRACSSSRRCAYDSCMDHSRIRHRSVSASRVFLCHPRRAKMNPRINGYPKMDPGGKGGERGLPALPFGPTSHGPRACRPLGRQGRGPVGPESWGPGAGRGWGGSWPPNNTVQFLFQQSTGGRCLFLHVMAVTRTRQLFL